MEEQEKNKGSWGGSRPGAGRKKRSKLIHAMTVKISEEAWNMLDGAKNKSELVDDAIMVYFGV